jgi:hypothetical protein
MCAPYGPFLRLLPRSLPKNVVGEVTATVNGFGALAAFAGSYAVGLLQARTGNPELAFY